MTGVVEAAVAAKRDMSANVRLGLAAIEHSRLEAATGLGVVVAGAANEQVGAPAAIVTANQRLSFGRIQTLDESDEGYFRLY